MDKITGLIALIVIGAPLVIMTLAFSWVMDDERMDTRQHNIDSDIRIYIPSWHRNRRSNNRHDMEGDK